MPARKPRLSEKKPQQRQERRDSFVQAVPKARKRAVGRSTTQETPLHVRARAFELEDDLRAYVRERSGFKLGKYGLHISRITVRLEDIAGPKGAPAFACRFKVVLAGMREVVVEATGTSPREAFDVASDAIERAVRRLLERTRAKRLRGAAG